MSILIKDVNMPKDCMECPFRQGDECWALCKHPQISDILNKRPKWCPIIELKDHGDLIDRDKLLNRKTTMDYRIISRDAVIAANAVIEKEPKENEKLYLYRMNEPVCSGCKNRADCENTHKFLMVECSGKTNF